MASGEKDPVPKIEPTFDRDLIALIQRIIRTKTAVYNIIPPAADIQAFIVKLYNEVKEEKPADEFGYIDKKVDEWFEKNRIRWLSQIEPRRVRTVIKRLTTAIRMNNFGMIKDEDLRLVREYIEILPEIEELRNAVAEALYENVLGPRPTTSKFKIEQIRRLVTHPEFIEISKKLGIKPIIDEAAERVEELIMSLTAGKVKLPYDKLKSLVVEVSANLKNRHYKKVTKYELGLLITNFDKLSERDKETLKEAIRSVLENPPPAETSLFDDYLDLVGTFEFAKLIDLLGLKLS